MSLTELVSRLLDNIKLYFYFKKQYTNLFKNLFLNFYFCKPDEGSIYLMKLT